MGFTKKGSAKGGWKAGEPDVWRDDASGDREHMSALAERFPCLVGTPGVRRWDPELFDRWAQGSGVTAAQLHAARFILNVWDSKRAWRCGHFDLLHALDHWDDAHRAAVSSWMADPWWPVPGRTVRSLDDDEGRETAPPESY